MTLLRMTLRSFQRTKDLELHQMERNVTYKKESCLTGHTKPEKRFLIAVSTTLRRTWANIQIVWNLVEYQHINLKSIFSSEQIAKMLSYFSCLQHWLFSLIFIFKFHHIPLIILKLLNNYTIEYLRKEFTNWSFIILPDWQYLVFSFSNWFFSQKYWQLCSMTGQLWIRHKYFLPLK